VSQGSYGGHSYQTQSYGSHGGISYGASVETPTSYYASTSAASTANASIAVTLPADAKVFVNDQETSSTGGLRNYVSKGLEAGKTYAYKLRVEFEQEGEKIVEHKVLKLRAGDNLEVSFGSEGSSQLASGEIEEPVNTELKVEVPADAQVFLSSVATKQQGTLRSFITQRLVSGQTWEGYTVRVELERDGQKLVKERTLTMVGGQTYELAFDFEAQDDDMKLALLVQ